MSEDLINKVIGEILNLFKTKYPEFKGIYFFGSRIRNSFTDYSDVDLCLIFDRTIDWKFESEIFDSVCPFMIKYDLVLDIKIYKTKDIEQPITPLRENIKNQGIFYASK